MVFVVVAWLSVADWLAKGMGPLMERLDGDWKERRKRRSWVCWRQATAVAVGGVLGSGLGIWLCFAAWSMRVTTDQVHLRSQIS